MKSNQGDDLFFLFLSRTPGLLAIINETPLPPLVYTRIDFLRQLSVTQLLADKPGAKAQASLLYFDRNDADKVAPLSVAKQSGLGLSQFVIKDYVSTPTNLPTVSVEAQGVKSDYEEKFDDEDDQGVCDITGIPIAAFYRVGSALFQIAERQRFTGEFNQQQNQSVNSSN